jgi:tetratricopeptide (TPR) repeat protein
MQGNNDLAIKYFELSLAADPKFSDAQNNLGIAYLNVKNNDKAVYHFREAHLYEILTIIDEQHINRR